ncbi:MAG: helix-turn-helix transcriptional regulator, partial [Pseudobacteriovorax sp.]|nr:helix-turn-helix transcriptional regulator [Pseudobacteriovorax sp.]
MAGRPKGAGEETKQQLISVASLMFAERGYHGVGISEILSEANVTKGSAYFHFPGGKEDLAYVCMEFSAEMCMQMMEGARASSESSHEA